MDKFIIGENPMREGSGTWIVRLLSPQAHIECIEGHVRTDRQYKHYTRKDADGNMEEWTLSAHFFFISEPEVQVIPLLDCAWRWYRAYMDWEDKNAIDNGEEDISE